MLILTTDTGITGPITDMIVTGDIDGDLVMGFMGIMHTNHIIMATIIITYIMAFTIHHIIMYQTTEMSGTTTIDTIETTPTTNAIQLTEAQQQEEILPTIVKDQIIILTEELQQ